MQKKRKKGAGTIRQRKDGRWEGRWVIGYDEKGLPKTRNVLARTKRECSEKLEHLKASCGDPKAIQVKPDMRFGDWMSYWYEMHAKPSIRVTTQHNYEGWIYNHAIPGLGHIPLNQLTQEELQQFFRTMKSEGRLANTDTFGAELSGLSVRLCYSICRKALDKAVELHLIHANPANGCKLPPAASREMKVLTHEEMKRFLIQAKSEGMYELYLLYLTTGLRRGELLALQWDDLDIKTGQLSISKKVYPVKGGLLVDEPKTPAAVRTILLPPAMVELLAEYRKSIFSPWMFPSRLKPDQPLAPSYVRKRLQAILERADCKKVRLHDLRHTFATMALEHGMDIKTLSALIGHASTATTLNTYTHITDEMRLKAALTIDRGIAKAPPQLSTVKKPAAPDKPFTPQPLPRRRPGTGCISQINEHLWEGRYSPVWPDGKKHSRDVYASTREKCEEKLKALILEMKAEIAQLRAEK